MSPAPGATVAPDDDWARVHPASPWVRGWAGVLAVLFVGAREAGEDVVRALVGQGGGGGPLDARSVLVGAAVVGAVLLVSCLVFLGSWWCTRYRLGPERLELRQGWLFRSRREMPYDRVQAVDLQHPLLPRLLGLAALRVEAADGAGEPALELAYLRRAEAEAVRRRILDRAAGVETGRGEATPPAPSPDRLPAAPGGSGVVRGPGAAPARPAEEGPVLARVPAGRLLGSVLLSTSVTGTLLAAVLVAAATAVALALFPGLEDEGEDVGVLAVLAAGALPLAFALVSAVWGGLNRHWDFTVRATRDGLRLRSGLTESTSQTLPPGRVQGVEIVQPLLWRPFGWHRVTVAVAGYGTGDGEGGKARDVALPVGTWGDVLAVLAAVAPDPGLDDGGEPGAPRDVGALLGLALAGAGEAGGFRHVPRRARWWGHPFTWRRHGFAATRTLLVVRRGRLTRRAQAVQHARIQDVRLTQGPVQRRLGVAGLTASLAGGASARLDGLDEGVLRELFAAESRHAAVSRRLADRSRWMLPQELARFERRTAEVAGTEVGRRELAAAGVVAPSAGPERATAATVSPTTAPTPPTEETP